MSNKPLARSATFWHTQSTDPQPSWQQAGSLISYSPPRSNHLSDLYANEIVCYKYSRGLLIFGLINNATLNNTDNDTDTTSDYMEI